MTSYQLAKKKTWHLIKFHLSLYVDIIRGKKSETRYSFIFPHPIPSTFWRRWLVPRWFLSAFTTFDASRGLLQFRNYIEIYFCSWHCVNHYTCFLHIVSNCGPATIFLMLFVCTCRWKNFLLWKIMEQMWRHAWSTSTCTRPWRALVSMSWTSPTWVNTELMPIHPNMEERNMTTACTGAYQG